MFSGSEWDLNQNDMVLLLYRIMFKGQAAWGHGDIIDHEED